MPECLWGHSWWPLGRRVALAPKVVLKLGAYGESVGILAGLWEWGSQAPLQCCELFVSLDVT